MYTARTALRAAAVSRPATAGLRAAAARAAPRRFNSTAAGRSRSWKGSAVRWGLAFGAVYYYNTSPVFADEAICALSQLPSLGATTCTDSEEEEADAFLARTVPPPAAFSNDDLPTVDSVFEEKRKQIQSKADKPADKPLDKKPVPEGTKTDAQTTAAIEGSPEALEEEAGQQGAFNPETGEINWDCPCLGGMADGPCGEDFKTAFSCFVFSEQEPKGMDCIDKFQGMQECFKKYPEIYGAELADDEDGAPTPDFGDEQPTADAQKTKGEPAGATTGEVTPVADMVVEAPASNTTTEVKDTKVKTASKPNKE
ncbi:Mitochondrial intermembrane space import and assembly protein 40 [Neonectria ditissima]|uniref:Mitochondrial intermembrane space import and assembly protein 40 n=1 Tax=Neonectria ditissima TaxID=78410 RepID=A0A0P7BB57_9HYPO|nr:Mitochondrial intermembrane space import and assembly protein 40 [Neonectria ditissima]